MIKKDDLQDISRALTHMLFRNVPLVEEIHAKQLVIDQKMMKNLNIEINNQIYSMLHIWFYGSDEEIQMLFKHIEFCSIYGRGTWEPARKVEI